MRRQAGVALLTVLLVVAIVSVVGAGMIVRQQLAIRATANQHLAQQIRHYQLGGETLARLLLARDRRGDAASAPRDDLGEAWAQPLPGFAVEGGMIALRIDDLAGRLNLNALLHDGQRDPLAQARLARLLRGLGIAPALLDKLALRLAQRPLTDVSELRLLGLDEAGYRRLRPYVAALPASVPLNVNTAAAPVLASLADGLGAADGAALAAARARHGGYASVAAFAAQPLLARAGLATQGLAVRSDWFAVRSALQLGERRQTLLSIVQRDANGATRVQQRVLEPAADDDPPAVATTVETLPVTGEP